MSVAMTMPVFVIFWVSLCLTSVKGDYYSATSELEALVDVEVRLVQQIEFYLQKAEEQQENIKRFLENVEKVPDDPYYIEDYFENPINAFITIKRLVHDWRYNVFEPVFDQSDLVAYKENLTKQLESPDFKNPTKDDLLGATRGLWRLQETYKLPTSQLANGILMPGDKNELNVTLSASDCYTIGSYLNELQQHSYAVDWLLEAKAKSIKEVSAFPFVSELSILEQLAPTLNQVGNKKLAYRLNTEILEKDPNHETALKDKPIYETQLAWQRDPRLNVAASKVDESSKSLDLYQRVCRGELRQSPRQQRKLRCFYSDRGVAFYRLGPFKVEQLNLDPYVAYFHNVISDDETDDLIEHGMGQVKRSRVGTVGNSTVSEVRTSQNTWLWYEQQPWLKNLKLRLEDITGLGMESAEPLQLVNYGIGGHYEPHYDFVEDKVTTFGWKGNRLLTALLYLNEVPMGGATAFPYLKLAVPPVKGSLLVWYNLHRSLDPDFRTKHAGCPVLMGSKWVCNEWFHEGAQEFRRPCGLMNDSKKSITFKPIDVVYI
ncbi:prolyl 4-hydroxylase subunit alpha-2 [Drosophila willistoni]|uniref:prolyl 4-hydroxylase subunit alpha-2 n=1 Tax=Drosophila willistoni TaxID=7260 RepID=UPI000C26CBEF|nr:prolyl 4-hydroxylase subunit alpha-2 [Drosophila willistoni]